MHYSEKLKNRIAELEAELAAKDEAVIQFQAHIGSAKFSAPGNDYIQCADVAARLVEIRCAR